MFLQCSQQSYRSSTGTKPVFINQSAVRNCPKMTNCERFRTKCYVEIAATLTLGTTYILIKCDKNVTCRRKLDFFFLVNELKFRDFTLIINETCYINKVATFFLLKFWGHMCEVSSRSVCWLFVKTLRSDKGSLRPENSKLV